MDLAAVAEAAVAELRRRRVEGTPRLCFFGKKKKERTSRLVGGWWGLWRALVRGDPGDPSLDRPNLLFGKFYFPQFSILASYSVIYITFVHNFYILTFLRIYFQ